MDDTTARHLQHSQRLRADLAEVIGTVGLDFATSPANLLDDGIAFHDQSSYQDGGP
jgi:hypothetical protein